MSELTEYMKALANERREHAEKMHLLESAAVTHFEFIEDVAALLGIETDRESFWDQTEDVKKQMVFNEISNLKAKVKRDNG